MFRNPTSEAGVHRTRHVFNKRHPAGILSACLAGTWVTVTPDLRAREVQVGRYSLLSAIPTEAQADLMATTVTVHFPEHIDNVGEAVRYLLQRSGYRPATAEATDSEPRQPHWEPEALNGLLSADDDHSHQAGTEQPCARRYGYGRRRVGSERARDGILHHVRQIVRGGLGVIGRRGIEQQKVGRMPW
jgi:hypothetical protein